MGIPIGAMLEQMTAADLATYEAADRCGLVPDNSLIVQLECLAAGVDPASLVGERSGPIDFSALYQQRKAMYGGQHGNIRDRR